LGAELIHLSHPLIRFAVDALSGEASLSNEAFALEMASSQHLRAGNYLFAYPR